MAVLSTPQSYPDQLCPICATPFFTVSVTLRALPSVPPGKTSTFTLFDVKSSILAAAPRATYSSIIPPPHGVAISSLVAAWEVVTAPKPITLASPNFKRLLFITYSLLVNLQNVIFLGLGDDKGNNCSSQTLLLYAYYRSSNLNGKFVNGKS